MTVFVSDTFTDDDATALVDHTGETGATWTKHASSGAGAFEIQSNRIVQTSASAEGFYYASGAPANADYDVEATLVVVTHALDTDTGVCGRMSTSNDTFYHVRYSKSDQEWQLYVFEEGVGITKLDFWSENLVSPNERAFKLEMRGTAIKGYVAGVERLSAVNSQITAAGKAGVRGFGGPGSSSEGQHLDDFTATDAPTGASIAAIAHHHRMLQGVG